MSGFVYKKDFALYSVIMYIAEIDEILKVPMTLASFLSFFMKDRQRNRKEKKKIKTKQNKQTTIKAYIGTEGIDFHFFDADNLDTSMAWSVTEKRR